MRGPRKIRVLLADDSAAVRRVLRRALDAHEGMQVVSAVPNGRLALHAVRQNDPDVIVLDIDMPEMDGLETLKALRARGVHIPVVMFSSQTTKGARIALDALSLGADHCVAKPRETSVAASEDRVRKELAPVLRGLVDSRKLSLPPAGGPQRLAWPPGPPTTPSAVVIAVSTGGPNALREVVPRLPATLSVPVFIVQHMPPLFTQTLAHRLDSESALQVAEAEDGIIAKPGDVWIAPGDYHMEVGGTRSSPRIHLHQGPRENSCRPAADVLFRSAAELWGPSVLGVVMTGMGADGALGSEAIVKCGGRVIAQDAASCTVYGMPRHVVDRGLASAIVPLDELAHEITASTAPPALQKSAS